MSTSQSLKILFYVLLSNVLSQILIEVPIDRLPAPSRSCSQITTNSLPLADRAFYITKRSARSIEAEKVSYFAPVANPQSLR